MMYKFQFWKIEPNWFCGPGSYAVKLVFITMQIDGNILLLLQWYFDNFLKNLLHAPFFLLKVHLQNASMIKSFRGCKLLHSTIKLAYKVFKSLDTLIYVSVDWSIF